MRVLALDPGYDRLGVAVVEKSPETNGAEHLVYSTCLHSDKTQSLDLRIFDLCQQLELVIDEHTPQFFAAEKVFMSKNQKTVMGVAEARGAFAYLAHRHDLSVHEYTPLQIKSAITGQGNATKSQVMSMLPRLISVDIDAMKERSGGISKGLDDEMDAIAVALTFWASYSPAREGLNL